jgi:sugar/nucleoside kinase (ribokinase family)
LLARTAGRYAPSVIVVVGQPTYRPLLDSSRPLMGTTRPIASGPAVECARAAVAAGSEVQLVAKIGTDPEADAILLELARDGIGHVAVLRDASLSTPIAAVDADEAPVEGVLEDPDEGGDTGGARDHPTLEPVLEAADVELALRYLSAFAVVVAAQPLGDATLAVIADAASYSGARVVIVGDGVALPGSAADATVLAAPVTDPDGRFAALVGRYAAGLDAGTAPDESFASAVRDSGWEPTTA